MTVRAEKIVAAAEALAASGLRAHLMSVAPNQAHRLLPEIWPHIEHILTMCDAAGRIANHFHHFNDLVPGLQDKLGKDVCPALCGLVEAQHQDIKLLQERVEELEALVNELRTRGQRADEF